MSEPAYDLSLLEPMSVEEYLRFEQISEFRHEYAGGYITAMAGASEEHESAAMRLASDLHHHLRGKRCRVYKGDMKLQVSVDDRLVYYYPDIMVVCDPADQDRMTRTSPVLIVEVLSTDWRRDMIEKVFAYRHIPSLQEYVVLDPKKQQAYVYRKEMNWAHDTLQSPAELILASVGFSVSLAEVFAPQG